MQKRGFQKRLKEHDMLDVQNVIVVLEDMQERIDWLQDTFPDTGVIWVKSVKQLLDELKFVGKDNVALILLDHDIGGQFAGSADEDGLTGFDAAKSLTDWSDIPVIIWSINPVGAKKMHDALSNDGFVVARIPFMDRNMGILEKAIESQL